VRGERFTTLADLCESVRYGYTASARLDPCEPRFLRITDIVPESLSWESVPYCEIDDSDRERFALMVGDIVVARTGATVGYAKLIRDPVGAVFASYLVRFRVNPAKAHPAFVGRLVESHVYKSFVQSRLGGAAQPNASAPVLGSFEFALPSKHDQIRIANVLAAYDDLIDTTGGGWRCWKRLHGSFTGSGLFASASPATNTPASPTACRRGGSGSRLRR
jgi:type I restriction enzyme S subunit